MANQPMAAGFLSENGYSAADDVYDIEMLIGLTVVAPLVTFNAYFDFHMCRTSLTVIWRRGDEDDSQQPAMTMMVIAGHRRRHRMRGPYYRRRSINQPPWPPKKCCAEMQPPPSPPPAPLHPINTLDTITTTTQGRGRVRW